MSTEMPSRENEGFLYENGPGRVYYCACSDRVVLEYKAQYLVFRRVAFRHFLHGFSRVLQCPALRAEFQASGRLDLEGCNGRTSMALTLGEAAELFELMDTAALFLEAQAAACKRTRADL